MNPALGLGVRDALDAMDSPFILEAAEGSLALDFEDNLVEPAQVRRVGVHDLDVPVLELGVAGIQAVQVGGE